MNDPQAQGNDDTPRMYGDFAAWWPLLSSPADYAEEAAFYWRTLQAASVRPLRCVLELGSGGGNNASYMKAHAELVLVDRAPGMLAVSRALNPECEHVEADMRAVRLERHFDGIFVHDAVSYMQTEAELRQVIESAWLHCAPGGAALFAPDHVAETFRPATDCGGHDGPERAMRYLSWTWDPDPTDTTCITDYAFLLREADGSTSVARDRHVEGLFPRATWLRLLAELGFEAEVLSFDHSELEPGSYEIFVARKPDP